MVILEAISPMKMQILLFSLVSQRLLKKLQRMKNGKRPWKKN